MGRNKGMYFTSVMAITAMMLILGLFFVAFVNVNMFAQSIGKDYNVIQIYMKDGNTPEITEAAGAAINKIKGVEKAEYVDKNEALGILKES
jgi:cell division transport system permease protein